MEEKDSKPVLEGGVEQITSFEKMGLKLDLLRRIYDYDFQKPSSIQQLAVVPIISGRDVIAQAPRVTGKTTMLAISVCQIVDANSSEAQALILSPSYFFSANTKEVISAIGKHLNVRAYAWTNGKSVDKKNLRKLEGAHVVAGTPDNVLDIINVGALQTRAIRLLILDGFDEVLSWKMDQFYDQINNILRHLPSELQVVSISKSLTNELQEITSKLMTHPVRPIVNRGDLPEGIKQFLVDVSSEHLKFVGLLDVYANIFTRRAVIFCDTRKKADRLTIKMRKNEFSVSTIYGDMPRKERDAILKEFRSDQSRTLITTDGWARGLDFPVDLVINYDMPNYPELYVERIECFRRFGVQGVAIIFVKDDEYGLLNDIEECYSSQIDEMPFVNF